MTTTTTVRTNRFSGNCDNCIYPVVLENDQTSADTWRRGCPSCGTLLTLERLYGSYSDHNCDSRCQYAIGNLCECSCGGANHRAGWIAPTFNGEVPASLVDRFRKAAARRAAQGQARREANAARKAAKKAEGILARVIITQGRFGNPDFLLTEAQPPAHATEWERNAFADILTRFHSNGYLSDAQFDLMKKIANKPAPAPVVAPTIAAPAGRVSIVGDVVFTKTQESDYGLVTKCLVLLDGGAKVWGTLPRGCQKGQRITFKATFTPKADDPFFAFYSRPSGATVLGDSQAPAQDGEDSLS